MTALARSPRPTALKIPGVGRIWLRVSLRPIFVMLIAAAMLFAPLTLQSGRAMAVAPSDHHAQMMDNGHCGDQPAESEDGKIMAKSCCVAMCSAITVAPSASIGPPIIPRPIEPPSLVQFEHSFLAELPTPPPRLA